MFRLTQIILIFAFIFVAFGQDLEVKPKVNEEDEGRIVGGLSATIGQFKYQASLRLNGRHFCGGSIYNVRWIITAAHCISWIDSTMLPNFLVYGGTILSNSGTPYAVRRIVIHPGYKSSPIINDIGLVQTTNIIEFNSLVGPILPNALNIRAGASAVVSGWGLTSYPGSVPLNLQYLYVNSVDNSYCSRRLSGITIRDICTLRSTGYGVCSGDSGGPLALNGTLIGVVSRGVPCARGYPDIFTRVSYYYTWILTNAI